MAFLLDTNVVSELRRPRPHGAMLAWLQSVEDADLHLASGGKREGSLPRRAEISKNLSTFMALGGVAPAARVCHDQAGRHRRVWIRSVNP